MVKEFGTDKDKAEVTLWCRTLIQKIINNGGEDLTEKYKIK